MVEIQNFMSHFYQNLATPFYVKIVKILSFMYNVLFYVQTAIFYTVVSIRSDSVSVMYIHFLILVKFMIMSLLTI